MDADTAVLVAVITAATGAMIALAKVFLPYVAKRRSSRPPPPVDLRPAAIGPAEDTGRYAAVVDAVPAPASLAKLEAEVASVKQTVASIKPENFVTKDDLRDFSTTVSDVMSHRFDKQIEELEDKVESASRRTGEHLTRIERSLGRLEGRLGKPDD